MVQLTLLTLSSRVGSSVFPEMLWIWLKNLSHMFISLMKRLWRTRAWWAAWGSERKWMRTEEWPVLDVPSFQCFNLLISPQSHWPLYLPFLISPSSTSPPVWSEGNLSAFFRRVFQNFSDYALLVYIIEAKLGMERETGLPKEVGRIHCVRIKLLSWIKIQSFCWSRRHMLLHDWILAAFKI